MKETIQYDFVPDRRGVIWDLLLYIPTVVALATIASSFWYSDDHKSAYVFFFLACFFFIAGVNRVFKTRLLLFPSASISLLVQEQSIGVIQKNGIQVDMVKDIRYYPDYAGKTFGISGLDGAGKQLQLVFHKGQFVSVEKFEAAQSILKSFFKK